MEGDNVVWQYEASEAELSVDGVLECKLTLINTLSSDVSIKIGPVHLGVYHN